MFIKTLKKALLPLATLVTPNAREIQLLFPDADSIDQCAEELLDLGCEHVLVTGADEPTPVVHNVLYSSEFETETFHWERLPAMYHGSGCTLAAACAGLIAQGLPLFDAINEAQEYTFNALKDGHALGQGQLLPNRLFWAQSRETEGEEPDESDEG
jgi:hydroxymethylpyrimidine/phosphomethylpyrimidine kinase